MGNSEANIPKRRVSKSLVIIGCVLLAYLLLAYLAPIIAGSTSETKKSVFMGSVFTVKVINPATVNAEFEIRNVGSVNGIPNCMIKVQDVSGTYSGYDYPIITTEVKPMGTVLGNVNLTITNQGASFVTEGSVTCD